MKRHQYEIKVEWSGIGDGATLDYESYSRNHVISGVKKEAYCTEIDELEEALAFD